MSESEDQPVGQVTTAIHRAYRECLAARNQWAGVNGRVYDDEVREELHADLNQAVMGWFEALYPYLSSQDGVSEYWEDVELWRVGVKQTKALVCQKCETRHDPETADPNLGCKNCGAGLGWVALPARNDDGDVEYEYATGLETLTEWTDKTEVVTEKKGRYRPTTVQKVKPLRLPPEALIRAARLLDQAAEELGLLATVTAATPRTELTDDMIEGVEEWRQKNLE